MESLRNQTNTATPFVEMKIPEPVVATPQPTVVDVSIENEVASKEPASTPVENEPIERKKKYDFNNLLGKIKEFLDNVE
jgi:cell division protein FtsA